MLAERRGRARGAERRPGAILIVGERLATVPGGLSAAAALAARPAPGWPGCRAGPVTAARSTRAACPTCCPAAVRSATPAPAPSSREAWGLETGVIPSRAGRDTDAIIAAAAAGTARRAAGRPGSTRPTWPTRRWPRRRWTRCRSWSAWSCGTSAVTRRADVVLPVAPAAEKAGSFLDWEGRLRTFETVLQTTAMTDGRVLDALAARARRRSSAPAT